MAQTITSADLGQDNTNQQNQQDKDQAQQAGNSGASSSSNSSGSTNSNNNSSSGGYQQQTGQPSQQQSTVQNNPNQQQGSGYTNIQKVLQANQGNKIGQAIGSGIQGQAQQGQQQLGQSQQNFQQQTAQNALDPNASNQLVQNVLSNATQYVPGTGNDSNTQTANQFQQLISGQYAGPTQLNNTAQLQSQAANVGQLAQATGSQAGQVGLLQRFVGSPQYTSGQQNLDQLLLGQTGGQDLAAARRAALQLQGQTAGAINGAQAVGQQNTSQAQAFGQNVQNQLGQTVTDQNTALQAQATQAQAAKDTQYQKTLADLQSGNISSDEASLLGLTSGQQISNDLLQNIGNYISEDPTKASAQNVASSQDYAKLNALKQLAGQYGPQTATDIFGQYQDPTQAGTFSAAPNAKADQTDFQNVLNQQNTDYNNVLNPAQNQYQQAQDIFHLMQVRNAGGSDAAAAQQQLQSKYSGALGGDSGQQTNWALSNINTTQQAYNAALAQLQQAYGGVKNINITPAQVAAQAASNQTPINSAANPLSDQTQVS